jgi:cell division protein FtsQ
MAKINFRKYGSYLALGTVAAVGLLIIISATKSGSSKRCKGLVVQINNSSEQFLVTREDIEKRVTGFGNDPVDGKILDNIDLQKLEKRVLENKQIKACEAFTDLNGQLVVEVDPYVPVARVLGGGLRDDRYMDEDGVFFPVSRIHASKVPLLSGSFFETLKHLRSEKNQDVKKLIDRIIRDPFWSAQITQLNIERNKETYLVPLLGDHKIEFGKPEKIESKLKKLMVFYKQILPKREWEDFKHISLKYENQIVCN